jgi:hypothetical protein
MKELKLPQHEKLEEVKEQSQQLGEFLEWLQSRYTLCELLKPSGNDGEYWDESFVPVHRNIQHILAEYFGIDYDELMQEKDRLLEYIRSQD